MQNLNPAAGKRRRKPKSSPTWTSPALAAANSNLEMLAKARANMKRLTLEAEAAKAALSLPAQPAQLPKAPRKKKRP